MVIVCNDCIETGQREIKEHLCHTGKTALAKKRFNVLRKYCKYLGVHIESANTFKLSSLESRSKFYRSTNGIFYKCKGNMCETVMMHLFSSYCKPILL